MAVERPERGKDLAKQFLVIKADRFSAQQDMWPNIQREPQYQQFLFQRSSFPEKHTLRAGDRDAVVHQEQSKAA